MKKYDVADFARNFESNLAALSLELEHKTYCHGPYFPFCVKDPKLRIINKAAVRDRVVHHAVFSFLYQLFDRCFIFDSYSSRLGKGTHRAIKRLRIFANKASKNNSRSCFVLKCDIKKFFDSVDQDILLSLIKKQIQDGNTLWLLGEIIKSFKGGIPLGNVTSQIFANIYLNEFDQFVKRKLKIKYYIRYCDDFVILSESEEYLKTIAPQIDAFLRVRLSLTLHPNKITIRTYHQGVDFLGYVVFPHHVVMRPKTKRRMFKKLSAKLQQCKDGDIEPESFHQTLQSYFGVLKHCDSFDLGIELMDFLLEMIQ